MATEETKYFSYADAALIHILLMRLSGETHYGVFERDLVESALARPRQAAAYEHADLIRQAATLCYGLIKNHPWVGGNKRTATAITNEFLKLNGRIIVALTGEVVDLALAIEGETYGVTEIESWLQQHVAPFP
ncbi:MAG: type II toxin-antitoxin system death-on-curing family toxin [Acidobacteria bacterium]|nr:MAG: type II toxin-antitoxin system death-on-curing family toxin [Acidobacteriota bacterium]